MIVSLMIELENSLGSGKRSLDDIGKGAFGFAEIPDAGRQQQHDSHHGHDQAGPVKRIFSAQNTPPKPINHAHDRVQRVEQAIRLSVAVGDDVARKTHRRNVKSELDNERHDESKVPVFHHQRGNPYSTTNEAANASGTDNWRQ